MLRFIVQTKSVLEKERKKSERERGKKGRKKKLMWKFYDCVVKFVEEKGGTVRV